MDSHGYCVISTFMMFKTPKILTRWCPNFTHNYKEIQEDIRRNLCAINIYLPIAIQMKPIFGKMNINSSPVIFKPEKVYHMWLSLYLQRDRTPIMIEG